MTHHQSARRTEVGPADGWGMTTLGDEAVLKNGTSYGPHDWKDAGTPIIRIQNLKDRMAPFNFFQGDVSSRVLVHKDDLLFSWSGSKGTSFGPHIWWGELGVLNQHIFRVDIKPVAAVEKDFLFYVLQHLTALIEEKAYGIAALVHVRKGDLEATRIPLPSVSEQREIASVLRTVQRTLVACDAVLAATRELKASLTRYLFTYGPVPFEQADRESLKDSDIGELPASWTTATLGEIATLQRGKDLPASRRQDGTIPVVGSNGIVGYHDEAVADGPGIAVGRSGSVGAVTFVPMPFWPLNTSLWVKNYHGNEPRFVYYLLQRIDFRRYAAGVSVPTLNRNLIHPLVLAVPNLVVQRQIAAQLSAVDAKLEAEESRRTALERLFLSLLQNLMTAKVRLPKFVKGKPV
jgi:type I restriction enzyme S subunit